MRRALARAGVKAEYDRIKEEFILLDEFLKARADAGITQAEVAERIGTSICYRAFGIRKGDTLAFNRYVEKVCSSPRLSS